MDPHEPQKRAAAELAAKARAEEKMRLQSLIDSEAGRWILGRLLETFETQLRRRPTGHNSADSYEQGKQDCAREYRDLVIKHFGHAAIDKIAKGKS